MNKDADIELKKAIEEFKKSSHMVVEDVKPITYGWQCPVCGRVNAPWVKSCFCQISPYITTEWDINIPSYCQGCSNHPSNGGSSICHCTLGSTQITCNTDSK